MFVNRTQYRVRGLLCEQQMVSMSMASTHQLGQTSISQAVTSVKFLHFQIFSIRTWKLQVRLYLCSSLELTLKLKIIFRFTKFATYYCKFEGFIIVLWLFPKKETTLTYILRFIADKTSWYETRERLLFIVDLIPLMLLFLVFETLCYVRIKDAQWHRLSVTVTNVEAAFRTIKHIHDLDCD